ncbi:MAG: PBP1A family penicillin-binding protein [Geminicoccaceae bacterium]
MAGAGKGRRSTEGAGRARRAPAAPRRGLAGRLVRLVAVLVLAGLVGWVGLFVWYAPRLPDTAVLVEEASQVSVRVLAADGSVLAERGVSGRPYVRLDEVSPWLVKAVVATEDRRFFDHGGVDPVGVLRAVASNLRAGAAVEGGSTITQQLAKNLYLSNDRTFRRKLEELVLAIWLESRLSKEQILELYLNRVYLGAGAYGVEAAAQRYFGKPAAGLTLAESALIAGLLKAPSRLSPTSDLAAARQRAAVVLALMQDQGVIDQAQRLAARERPATLAPERVQLAGWLVDWVLEALTDELGKPTRDLVVRTTLEPALQVRAEQAVDRLLPVTSPVQAAVVVLDEDGAVRAMVGGRRYAANPYNRAVNARRQPGSAFKPFVYLAALETGWTPSSAIDDAPVRVGDWRPANSDGTFHGRVSLTQAMALSLNAATVRLGEKVGRQRVAETARRLGISSPLEPVASLPLGTAEVGVLELAGAYLPIADGGIRRPAWAVESVTDDAGRVLYRHKPTEARVIDRDTAADLQAMLRAVVSEGTGREAALPGRSAAGKTGTTQDIRDAWFVGFAGSHVAAVWMGHDDGRPMRGVSGGTIPARIWREVMLGTPPDGPAVASARPPVPVRRDNGLELLLDWVQRSFGGVTE